MVLENKLLRSKKANSMQTNMHPLLEKVLMISGNIESLISDLAWDKILELSQERDLIIREYFKTQPSHDDKVVAAKVLANICQSDKKISLLIEKNKRELVGEGISLKNNQHAIQQYHQAQAG